MPIYDYRCMSCNTSFELLVKTATVPACPACASTQLEKQVSAPAPPGQLKGIVSSARAQASREGHFSNYKPAERPRS